MSSGPQLRWCIYALLIAIAIGGMATRVCTVTNGSRTDPSPFLSANDRSRWCTIRALVEHGTYAIDRVIFKENGDRNRSWHTIDLVRHKGSDGREHYYSSKPTLLPTLLAGEYWLIRQITGASLSDRGKLFYVARLMLLLTNVVPWGLALVGMAWLIERYGTTDIGRIFAMAVASQGTFLTTFGVTLNNHTIAAVSVVFALVAAAPLWAGESRSWGRFFCAGFFAAFAAANELPALAFLALLGLILIWLAPKQTLLAFTPPVLAIAAAALGTNYLAHGSWQTPYAHRNRDGAVLAELAAEGAAKLDAEALPDDLPKLPPQTQVTVRQPGQRWMLWDEAGQNRYAVHRVVRGNAAVLELRKWDDWYDYEGTYWTPDQLNGVDKGEKSHLVYAFNLLAGHHGLFSLTPVWLLSVVGLFLWARSDNRQQQGLATAIAGLTLIVFLFYLSRPLIDRNYGGVTCGLRWLFWLIPLWVLVLLPAVDQLLQNRWGILLAVLALGVSVFSAQYAVGNPWSHPWIFDYWTQLGWIRYD
jgi:hypothetical protein